ncbi:hypothetical protein EJ05DRAFT_497952 [Pseudovirgaria hyperparasitica]|uniref:Uncharacterized protein n=1 Tax=Pseudovirgaria hyperparasitica TaxID=470096 RepID=A0A6A6WJB6_9PEZI|nr:uncharacterized protein EJ05DRAFT_497952 [Pseudovirgaria hyperparasitica]KAF2761401.1 hypothetical protein EJ05DRAFT_497952 [Pseudovirgaria hyperparasitica]
MAENDNTEWDEAQCKEALGRLERLQEQLDCLRPCIPHILDLLRNPQPSPQHLVNEYKETAIGSSRKLTAFKAAWESQETRKIMGQAQQSFRNDMDLTAGYQVPHYGWANAMEHTIATEIKNESNENQNSESDESEVDVSVVVKDFRNKYPHIKIITESENSVLKIRVPFDLSALRFTISRNINLDEDKALKVQCGGSGSFSAAVTRCIASRPSPNHLPRLLDMIAAFHNSGYNPCARCKKIIDDNGLKPAARRSRSPKPLGADDLSSWESWHEGCLN